MSKEIKFRFYTNHYRDCTGDGKGDIYEKYPDDLTVFNLMTGDYSEENEVYCYCDGCKPIICQFTGLKDKNGKEVYCGDILQTSNTEDKTIDIWDKDEHGYTICSEKEGGLGVVFNNWYPDYDNDSVYDWRYVEVIGNIYENPELIK